MNPRGCAVFVAPPAGASFDPSSSTLLFGLHISDIAGESDQFSIFPVGNTPSVGVRFSSFPDSSIGTVCSNCTLAEDGTMQQAGTIAWSDGTVDTFFFQSASADAPEPAAFLLALIGILALALPIHRRWVAKRRSRPPVPKTNQTPGEDPH
jgi:hypothetical protein